MLLQLVSIALQTVQQRSDEFELTRNTQVLYTATLLRWFAGQRAEFNAANDSRPRLKCRQLINGRLRSRRWNTIWHEEQWNLRTSHRAGPPTGEHGRQTETETATCVVAGSRRSGLARRIESSRQPVWRYPSSSIRCSTYHKTHSTRSALSHRRHSLNRTKQST